MPLLWVATLAAAALWLQRNPIPPKGSQQSEGCTPCPGEDLVGSGPGKGQGNPTGRPLRML